MAEEQVEPVNASEPKLQFPNQVFVGNLTWDINEEELIDQFKDFGIVYVVGKVFWSLVP